VANSLFYFATHCIFTIPWSKQQIYTGQIDYTCWLDCAFWRIHYYNARQIFTHVDCSCRGIWILPPFKRSRSRRGSLQSCECWLLIVSSCQYQCHYCAQPLQSTQFSSIALSATVILFALLIFFNTVAEYQGSVCLYWCDSTYWR